MKTALIGGSGFIGTVLAGNFNKHDIDFTIFDKKTSSAFPDVTVEVNILEKDKLVKLLAGHDVIINLAAEHQDNVTPVELYQQVNVEGAVNVCEAAEINGIKKIIFTSSVAVYGNSVGETDENGDFNYFNEYGRTKYEAEKVYMSWLNKSEDHSLQIVRPSVVFGKNNRGNVYNLLRQIASGKFLMVGKGNNKKSMAYVENVAAFLEHLLSFEKRFIACNYVDKPDFDMNTLVETVYSSLGKKYSGIHFPMWLGIAGASAFDILSKLTGKKFPISVIRVKKFCSDSHFTSSSIEETGYKAPVEIKEALAETIKAEFL